MRFEDCLFICLQKTYKIILKGYKKSMSIASCVLRGILLCRKTILCTYVLTGPTLLPHRKPYSV